MSNIAQFETNFNFQNDVQAAEFACSEGLLSLD